MTASRPPGCAIYARVSTADQNCEVQIRELREYVQRRGWVVVKEYIDTGISGAKASRPALDLLMQDARRIVSTPCWSTSWTVSGVRC